uniref:SGNH hydrolase-type esterase domain-containing protein n=1 Tax=Seriola dumerili TaxID=41447 RepID=A0A3B4U6Q4_SERDU
MLLKAEAATLGNGPSSKGAAPLDVRSMTDANPTNLASATCQLPPNLAVYSTSVVSRNPEILIVGDSVVRYLTLPGAITYCLSELIPTLIDLHPTVNIVLTNVGTNDATDKNSSKLQADPDSLCYTIESLGKRCLMSGPIPTFSKNSERFSRLFSLHDWLKYFYYFWTNLSLYRADGVHPNRKGTKHLTTNFIRSRPLCLPLIHQVLTM